MLFILNNYSVYAITESLNPVGEGPNFRDLSSTLSA